MILNAVVRSSFNNFGQSRPLTSIDLIAEEQPPFLVIRPLTFFNIRTQMIEPSFPTLLSYAIGNEFGNVGPFFGSIFFNKFKQNLIFFLSPSSFGEHEVVDEWLLR